MRKTTFLLFAMLTLVSILYSCTPPELENDKTEQSTVGEEERKEIDPDKT